MKTIPTSVFIRTAWLLLGIAVLATIAGSQVPDPVTALVTAHGSVAPLPPMGWASWNHFFCEYNEQTIRAQADALVSTGMRESGYKYVVIQECIARQRDNGGNLIVDATRFPSGMASLVSYIHHLGLKAGIYTDIGRHTCFPSPQYQGSYGHEERDAQSFATWGIDLVEMDYCNREQEHTGRYVYEKMAAALRATGRPMVFYLCSWGNEQPWEWAQGVAQMWRTDYDISLEKNHVEWWRLVSNFESNTAHSVFSGPESWNDADMLEVGNPGLNDSEAQAQMSMWAMSPSPLLAGADLTTMTARTQSIYTNAEVIAINQDPLGAGAELVSRSTPTTEVWQRSLGSRTGGEVAVMLLNSGDKAKVMGVLWRDLHLIRDATARDLWTHKDLPNSEGYRGSVAPHTAVLLRVKGQRSWAEPAVLEAENPGNVRMGRTTLFLCGECSRGYAVHLGGDGESGSLRFRNIRVTEEGDYQLRLLYVRNGLEDKMVSIMINDGAPMQVSAIMRSWNYTNIPLKLKAGENTIDVGYSGVLGFDLDRIELSRASSRP